MSENIIKEKNGKQPSNQGNVATALPIWVWGQAFIEFIWDVAGCLLLSGGRC
jgi:hypothetical protein